MCFPFQLIGALLLAINFKEADSFTIPSDGVRGFESHESRELLSSGEHDDSSEFRSVLVGQTSRTPMTGTVGQVTGTPKANVRLPISFHSDEHDDFSDEVRSLAGMLAPNAQVVSATPDAGSQPNSGQRITKRPDERLIVSAQPGKQVIIRTVTTNVNAQTITPIGKAIFRHSDEHDDYSDEIVSKVSVLANPSGKKVPAQMASSAVLGQTANGQHPIYRLRSGEHADLPWREHDDDIHVQIDPITKQVVNIRAEQKDSMEHDDLFSDEVIRSHIAISPRPAFKSSPAQLNAGIQTATGQILNQQNGQVRHAVPGPAQHVIIGDHVIRHSDEIDDISLEDLHVRSAMQTQTSATGGSVVASTETGGRNLFRDSDEHDVSLEDVIAAHSRPQHGQRQKAPVQQGVRLFRDSDERDVSSEVVRRILNQQNGQNLTTSHQSVHLVNDSDEHDDTSVEIILNIRNGTALGQGGLLIQQSGKVVSQMVNNPTAPIQQGVHFISRDSEEHDISLEDVMAVHSSLHNGQGQTAPGQQGVRLFEDSDERDLSSEVVRRILSQQNGQNLTTANQVVHLVHDSDEHDDTSVEIILNIRNGTAPGQGTLLIKQSGKVVGIDRSPRTGQNPTAPAQQGVHFISRHSDEHDDSIEIVGLVRKTAVIPPETTVIGGHAIRHSDEVDDDSLELHHIRHQSPPANGSVITTPDVQHHFRHSDEHDVSLEDFIGTPNRPMNGQIQVAPVQQGGHLLRDSDEHDDSRERTGRVLNHQGRKINTTVYLSRDSDEHDDLSLEVNLSLLPEIQRLFTDARMDTVAMPAVQEQGVAAVVGNRGNPAVRKAKELEVQFELEDILANPLFQQKIQEIDDRLKSAPDARGKRLIEKYAEALALTSPSFNAAPAIIKSSFYLPFLFTCLLVWFS